MFINVSVGEHFHELSTVLKEWYLDDQMMVNKTP